MTAIPRVPRGLAGPALFSYGFRPFFLFGALWAMLGIALWIPQYFGALQLPTAFSPLDWHVHEMLYGYLAAVAAGFLLTAIPNWTGRFPLAGPPLMALVALWLAGRVAILVSAEIGPAAAAVIDGAFLIVFAAVCLREIVAGSNWRNLRVLVVLALLAAGNVAFHVEVMMAGAAAYGARIGIAAAILLITLIGGRIIPSFTRNWLARRGPGPLPRPFAAFDGVAVALGALALAAWVLWPDAIASAILLAAAGLVHLVRLARWAGWRTGAEPLVWVLHLGYVFVPVGFLFAAAAILFAAQVPTSAAIHAWTAGAIGIMTLAVMTRASLGHTGQALTAGPGTLLIYAFVLVAALARIGAALAAPPLLLHIAAGAWCAAFAAFALAYGPALLRPRKR